MASKSAKGPSMFRAVVLSLIFPGLGQLYLRLWVKATIFIGLSVLSLWQLGKIMKIFEELYMDIYSALLDAINSGGYMMDVNSELASIASGKMDLFAQVKYSVFWLLFFTVVFIWALVDVRLSVRRMRSSLRDNSATGDSAED